MTTSPQSKVECEHKIICSDYRYTVKCTRETHCGYAKITIWVSQVEQDVQMGKWQSVKDLPHHLRDVISEEDLAAIMAHAERSFTS